MKFTYCLVLLLGLSMPAALAQSAFKPGYILPLTGDTLRGEVAYRSEQRNRETCRFRPSGQDTIVDYQPTQLRGYGFSGGKAYQSRLLVEMVEKKGVLQKILPADKPAAEKAALPSQHFLQLLQAGKLSLYRSVQPDDRETYYVGSIAGLVEPLIQQDTVMQAYNKSVGREVTTMVRRYPFRQKLVQLMADCPQVQPVIAQMELREKKLLDVFAQYNACVGSPTHYAAPLRKTSVGFSVVAGVYQSELDVPFENQENLQAGRQPTVGVGIVLTPGSFHHKLSAILQAQYVKQQYQRQFGSAQERKDIQVRFSSVRIPLMVRYTFLQGPVRPYAQAGLSMSVVFDNDASVSTTQTGFGPSIQQIAMRTLVTAPTAGAGFSFPIGQTGSIQLEARLEWPYGYSFSYEALGGARSVSVLAGYTFGK